MTTRNRLYLIVYGLTVGTLAIVTAAPGSLLQGLGVVAALGLLIAGIGGGVEDD